MHLGCMPLQLYATATRTELFELLRDPASNLGIESNSGEFRSNDPHYTYRSFGDQTAKCRNTKVCGFNEASNRRELAYSVH